MKIKQFYFFFAIFFCCQAFANVNDCRGSLGNLLSTSQDILKQYQRILDPFHPRNYRFKVPQPGANLPTLDRIHAFVDGFTTMTLEQKEAMKYLLSQCQYVYFPKFHAQLLDSFDPFIKNVKPDEKLIVILPKASSTELKSNDWMLEIIEAAYPALAQARFLVLDDASYSGKQASSL